MFWFATGIILLVTSSIAFVICLGLWTYEDAKVKSEHPPSLWVLVVLLVPNLVGLIIYLLIGRTNKQTPSPGKYSKIAIASAIGLALGLAVFISGILHFIRIDHPGQYGARQVGHFSAQENNLQNGVWTISAGRANGYSRRSPELNEAEQSNFQITSRNSSGSITLRIEQGQQLETIDIPNSFEGFIDLSAFEPGRMIIAAEFHEAEDVSLTIRWR